jgi:hypothetical protein
MQLMRARQQNAELRDTMERLQAEAIRLTDQLRVSATCQKRISCNLCSARMLQVF